MFPTSPEVERRDLHVMRHPAVDCDAYQTTDVACSSDTDLWIMSRESVVQHGKKSALECPSSDHYGDQTEYEGNDRKGDRRETLDATLSQAVNTESWEWVSGQPEQVNKLTELLEICSPAEW